MRISWTAVVLLVALCSCWGQLSGGQQVGFGLLNPDDLGKFLHDRRYVKQQLNCVLDRGDCDTLGNQLKFVIPEVIARNCRFCTNKQAKAAQEVMDFISRHYPDDWAEIQRKYNSDD